MSILQDAHSCKASSTNSSSSSVSRAETSKLKFLLQAVPQLINVDQHTPARAIIDTVKAKYGQEIALRQAQKVKATLCSRPSELASEASDHQQQEVISTIEESQHQNSDTSDPQDTVEDSHMQLNIAPNSGDGFEPSHNTTQRAPNSPPRVLSNGEAQAAALQSQPEHVHRSPSSLLQASTRRHSI